MPYHRIPRRNRQHPPAPSLRKPLRIAIAIAAEPHMVRPRLECACDLVCAGARERGRAEEVLRCYERVAEGCGRAHHGDVRGGGYAGEEVRGAHDGGVVDVDGGGCEGG